MEYEKLINELQATTPRLHVLFFPLTALQGHSIPEIQFAQKLACEGAIVTILCEEKFITRQLRSHSIPGQRLRLIALPEYSPPVEQLQERLMHGPLLVEPPVTDFLRSKDHQLRPALEQTMARLIEESKLRLDAVPPPTCIISDFYLSFSQDVANKFGIPRYAIYPSPSSCLCMFLYLPRLVEQGLFPVTPDSKVDMVIPGLPSFKNLELPQDWHEGYAPKEWMEYLSSAIPRLHESSGIIVNSFYAVERELLDVATTQAINPNKVPIYHVGPLLPAQIFHDELVYDQEARSQNYNEILQWLNKQSKSSVLYIAFGSMVFISIPQIHEIAKALESCKQPFLWILKVPPWATEASAILPQDFLSQTKGYGLVIPTWAPQLLILSHPSIGGFMSHCGWNSTLESLCNGVPMLTLPQFSEQCLNCKLVTEHLKVGVEVVRGADGVAESKEIEKGVEKLMQGEEGEGLRSRARRLREEAARCVSKGGSSHAAVRAFIDEAAKFSHKPAPI